MNKRKFSFKYQYLDLEVEIEDNRQVNLLMRCNEYYVQEKYIKVFQEFLVKDYKNYLYIIHDMYVNLVELRLNKNSYSNYVDHLYLAHITINKDSIEEFIDEISGQLINDFKFVADTMLLENNIKQSNNNKKVIL